MTRYAALLIGLVMIVLGGISFFAPALALQGVAYFHQGPRIYIAVAVRLVVGLIFVASAKPSRAPWLMYFFGGFTLVGAVLTPFMERPLVDLMFGRLFGGFAKPWAVAGAIFGLLVVYAVVPPRDVDPE